MAPKLAIACAGLGRMGKRHALNFLNRTPRAQLVAASSPDEEEHEWARIHLAPFGVTLYKDYDEMLRHEGLQAVVIASATNVHAEQAIKAIDADKHVLCEKPLSTRADIVSRPSVPLTIPSTTATKLMLTLTPRSRNQSSMPRPENHI